MEWMARSAGTVCIAATSDCASTCPPNTRPSGIHCEGPVKMSSRIDVPASGDSVPAGQVRVGGVAWSQHTGISAVEVALDGGDWQPAEISHPPTDDAWVQWVATLSLDAGDHLLRVRATDRNGLVQTGVERGVLPNGSTGWDTVAFRAA